MRSSFAASCLPGLIFPAAILDCDRRYIHLIGSVHNKFRYLFVDPIDYNFKYSIFSTQLFVAVVFGEGNVHLHCISGM